MFNGSFMKENIYRQAGSPEVDAAWQALGIDCKLLKSFRKTPPNSHNSQTEGLQFLWTKLQNQASNQMGSKSTPSTAVASPPMLKVSTICIVSTSFVRVFTTTSITTAPKEKVLSSTTAPLFGTMSLIVLILSDSS
jgi:hypothetical protein